MSLPEGVAVGDDVGVTSRIVAWDAEVMFKPLKLFSDVKNAPLSKAVRSLDITALCVMLLVMFKSYKTFTPVSSPPPFKVACTLASTALSTTPVCLAVVLPLLGVEFLEVIELPSASYSGVCISDRMVEQLSVS